MTTILQDITAVIRDFTGLPATTWRDDDMLPFSNLSQPCLIIRNQSGNSDKDIAIQPVDVWFFSRANGDQADQIATLNQAQALEDYFNRDQFTFGRIYDVQILGSVGAPTKDGQGRWAVPLNIQVRRSVGGLNNQP